MLCLSLPDAGPSGPSGFSTQLWVLSMEDAASTTAGRKGSRSLRKVPSRRNEGRVYPKKCQGWKSFYRDL